MKLEAAADSPIWAPFLCFYALIFYRAFSVSVKHLDVFSLISYDVQISSFHCCCRLRISRQLVALGLRAFMR